MLLTQSTCLLYNMISKIASFFFKKRKIF
jgi:hypothetical protein